MARSLYRDAGSARNRKDPGFVCESEKDSKRSSFVEKINRQKGDYLGRLRAEIDKYSGKRKKQLAPPETDILIVGGGIIGSSIAYWIKKRAPATYHVTVVEKDPTYQRCATTRSAGGVRQQFSFKENCQMAMFGAEFLRDYRHYLGEDAPDPQFNPEGYLFIADTDERAMQMEQNARTQRECGARIELMSQETLKKRFPFINNEDVKLASYGLQNEGWFNPYALLQGLKQYNLRHQTGYINAEVVDFRFRTIHDCVGPEVYEPTNHVILKDSNGELHEMIFSIIILAGGSQTAELCRLLRIGTGTGIRGVPIPIEPRKGAIYTFHAPEAPIVGFPFLVDPTRTYCRREGLGGYFICGRSPDREHNGQCDGDLDNADEGYFKEVLWPTLTNRVPAFSNIKPSRSWCGFYDYNYLDANAIIGWHPYYHHVIICSGFSDYGLQMAPAAGRAVMEMIIESEFTSIDLRRLSFERVMRCEGLRE